jgi:NAD(P)H dehydrogenase (quinone)
MIVITGATGQLGRLVVAALLDKKIPASNIVAAVRNAEKAKDLAAIGVQVRIADYNAPSTWDAALKGAGKVLLISSSEIGQRSRQHRSVIDAAKQAGVKLLAYTSVLRADTSQLGLAVEHRETESYIRTSGVPYVLLRNGWYTENYTMGIPAILAGGAMYGCAGGGRVSSAARADYAEAAAAVLTMPDQAGKVYELAGDSAYTHTEFAAEISRHASKKIDYVNLTEAEYREALKKAGLPDVYASLIADSDAAASRGALFDEGLQLSKLINRPTTPMSASVAAALTGQGKQ